MLRSALFFILILFSLASGAATFTVTSNADAGPGTLREALTLAAANGTAEKDFIHFNLPGTDLVSRTITLESQLPFVTSNMEIDGTTQLGAKLGLSDAKIMITVNRISYIAPKDNYTYTGILMMQDAKDIGIYGLYFKDCYDLKSYYSYLSGKISCAGVYIIKSSNIRIGAPGKGNIFTDNDYGVVGIHENFVFNENVFIQTNFFGLNPDGLTEPDRGPFFPEGIRLQGNNSQVGGSNNGESNFFGSNYKSVTFLGKNNSIINNRMAMDYFGNKLDLSNYQISSNDIYVSGSDITISDNLAASIRIQVEMARNFKILRNKDIFFNGNSFNGSIVITSSENGMIGTEDPADANILLSSNFYNAIFNHSGINIQVLKNSILCSSKPYRILFDDPKVPVINVLVNNATEYSGTATPNSKIYIYEDNSDCVTCNPLQYYTEITADASGNWKITGDFKGKRWLANTTINNNSSEYTQPQIFNGYNSSNIINHASCTQNNGSILLKDFKNVLRVEWFNRNNEKIAEGFEIKDLAAGNYYAKGYNGLCSTILTEFSIMDYSPVFNTADLKVTQPACGKNNGSISGLYAYSNSGKPLKIDWLNGAGKVVGNLLEIKDLGPGAYTLVVTDIGGCKKTYGPVILKQTEGPNIDLSVLKVQASVCNGKSGKITGIEYSGKGILSYTWKNEANQIVGNTPDLINVPSGMYILELKDETTCGSVFSDQIFVPEQNAIQLTESDVKISPAGCNKDNGSIQNIQVASADSKLSYQWYNEKGAIVANTIDLLNAEPGIYYLKVFNSSCFKESEKYTITREVPVFPPFSFSTSPATCNMDNGTLKINFEGITLPAAVRWVNSTGQNIGNSPVLTNITDGSYDLFFTNETGCEIFYNRYVVHRMKPLSANVENAEIRADNCGNGKGAVKNLYITGGVPPYVYNWQDEYGKTVSTSADLSNAKSGTYNLHITDNSRTNCSSITLQIFVPNYGEILPVPIIKPVSICAPGDAVISAQPISQGIYKLYDSDASGVPVKISTNGIFNVKVTESTSFFMSYSNGSCESNRIPVPIRITENSIDIPNSFTPNGDGINDIWIINGIENYPEAKVRIFSRNGEIIFTDTGYKKPFDGTRNGIDLPAGVYFYTIELRSGCRHISGSLTLLR